MTTNNFQLEDLMRKFITAKKLDSSSFLGVFSSDTLPTPNTTIKQCGIVNLQKDNQPGSHWVCWFNDPTNKYVEYMDSFGCVPNKLTEKFLRKYKKQIAYNTEQLQMFESKKCGYFCTYYLKCRLSGISMYDTLFSFKQGPYQSNENLLK